MSAVQLLSPFPPHECAERLRVATDREGLFGCLGSKPVIGRVSERSSTLRKRTWYNNPLQTVLRGKLVANGGGTIFYGKSGIRLIVVAFYAVWFTGELLGCSFAAMILVQRLLEGRALPHLAIRYGVAMSRRGGPVCIIGRSYPCHLCGELIPPGEPMLCVPFAPLPKWEPMTNFEGMICHVGCWSGWSERDRFVEQFNSYACDAIMQTNGSVDWLGQDGSVEEHQSRVQVVPRSPTGPDE